MLDQQERRLWQDRRDGGHAGALAATGKHILICDLDPQSSASQIFFGSSTVESLPRRRTVAAVFDRHSDPTPEHVIHPTPVPNISIIPSNNDLSDHNLPLPGGTPVSTTSLTPFLRGLRPSILIY